LVDTIRFNDSHADLVEYSIDGRPCRAKARREIIVCAGSFNSPQILQRSGIGPAEHLKRLEIPIVIDLPGVGDNYQDHFAVQVSYETWLADTLNDDLASVAAKFRMGLNYLVRRSGPMAHTGTYAGGFVKSHNHLAQPDLELNCNLWTRKYARTGGGLLDGFSGFTLLPMFLCPEARGSVRLTSRDPNEPPAIVSNSFQTRGDRQTMVRAVKLLRHIARSSALSRYIKREISPGPEIQSDGDIETYVEENGYTAFHSVGTCKMGHDAQAVVDERLRVRGLKKLRVVDASIMPRIVAGNTNAATMMIAEKGARMILDDHAA
jgi:choline dehydrogenase